MIINNKCQGLEQGSPIRDRVKVAYTSTRVVNSEYSSFRPIFALSWTPTIKLVYHDYGKAKLNRYPPILNIEKFGFDIYFKIFMGDFLHRKKNSCEELTF
jgi:hypothetical protein